MLNERVDANGKDPYVKDTPSLIASDRVEGTRVYGADGQHIGHIQRIILEKRGGRVAYAVLSFGGFLGLGHSHYPLPWGALKYNPRLNGFETGVNETQLRDAPAFSDDSWMDRNWERQTHTHYNVAPYW